MSRHILLLDPLNQRSGLTNHPLQIPFILPERIRNILNDFAEIFRGG